MSTSAVFFDFDFTLADSSRGICDCVNFALRTLGFPPVAYPEMCALVGLSQPETFRRLTGLDDARLIDQFRGLWVARADEVMLSATAIYPYVPPAIERLRSMGLRIGIVSSKFRHRIEAVLARDGLSGQVDIIVGSEDVSAWKPDPESLILAMNRLGATPSESVYVGDAVVDAEAARRAGVPFVAVLSGVTPAEHFAEYAPVSLLPDVSHLPCRVRHVSDSVAQPGLREIAVRVDPRSDRG